MRGLSRASWFALGIAALHLGLAWMMRTPGFGWGEDDSAFLLLSRELQNFQYRETQDILAPVHARFPPAFPAMLAVVGALVGDRIEPLIAFVALCSAASVLLLFDTVRRVLGEELAVLSTGLYAINSSALGDAGSLMSEAPFKLFLLLALWAASRETEGTRFAVIAGGATILAALTRTAGVVFIPALGAYWLWKRRYTWVFGLALAAVPVAAWLAFSFNAPDASDRRLYVADLKGSHETVSDALLTRFGNLRPRIEWYLTRHIPWALSIPTIEGTPVDNIVWVAAFLVFGTVGMIAFWRNWVPAALFLASYGLLLAGWRFALDRLVNPIVPLTYALLLAGAFAIFNRYVPRARRWAVLAVATVLAVGAIGRAMPELRARLACDRTAPADSPACWPLPERELLTLANWVRDSTPADALFLVPKERAFFVHTGRKTINQDRALREDTTTIGEYLRSRGVRYTVLTPIGVRARAHTVRVKGACRDFDLVKQFSPRTMLLQVAPETSPTDSTPACTAVREFSTLDRPAP